MIDPTGVVGGCLKWVGRSVQRSKLLAGHVQPIIDEHIGGDAGELCVGTQVDFKAAQLV